MNAFNPINIKDENLQKLMSLWLNYQTVEPKISKIAKGGSILLEWMTACMEFKVKKATLTSLKKSDHDVKQTTLV